MKKQFSYILLGLLMVTSLKGQIKIGENPQNLDPASVLELESDSRVLVITRMTTTQMENTSPLRGAVVYNTDTQCVHFYDGALWINLCDRPDEQTFTADAIVNFSPTMIITQDPNGTNFNFEVGEIRGENIVDTSINGEIDIQPGSITGLQLQDASISYEKLAEGSNTGEILWWNGGQWELKSESDLGITEQDGVIGNEYNTGIGLTGTSIEVTDGGATLSQDLNPVFATDTELANAITASETADGDTDAINEIQNLSIGTAGTLNQTVEVAISGGTNALVDIRDADSSPTNENQTVSAGTGISVATSGQNFEVTNDAPDLTVSIADGGNGNVTVGGTYPNLTIDVPDNTDNQNLSIGTAGTLNQTVEVAISGGTNALVDIRDADSSPTNENQTVSAGTGISVATSGQNFEVTNDAPDLTVSIADGGNGNVTVGGTYPNLTIDVPDNTDNQNLSIGTAGTLNQTVEVAISGGTNALVDIRDADSSPTNENQTVSAGTGISVATSGQNFEVTNDAPDLTVSIADGGNGNVTVGGTYPNLTIDVPDNTDNQNLSIGTAGTLNQTVEVAISGGTNALVDIRDADSSPTNENQTVSAGTGISVATSGQNFEVTNDAPDLTVSIADGGNGNVTVGGTYPNLTIDVPDNTDNQNLSIGTAGTLNQTVEVAISGGTNALVDIRDADSSPTNENQTVSAGTGISVATSGQNFEIAVANPIIAMGKVDALAVAENTIGLDALSGVERNSLGNYTVNLDTSIVTGNYIIQLTVENIVGNPMTIQVTNQGATSFDIQTFNAGVPDDSNWYFTVISF